MEKAPSVWIIGFPKSGNTWLSYLVSYSFNLPFQDFDDQNKVPKKSEVRNFVSGNNNWKKLESFDMVLKTHLKEPNAMFRKDDVTIYIIRDPRDVFVSYHYYNTHLSKWKGRLHFKFLGLFGRRTQIKWFVGVWIKHVTAWKDCNLIFKYENLLSSGAEYFNSVLVHNGVIVDSTIIEEAFDRFSFSNLSGGRSTGKEDQKSFFRKGVAGDWQNFLTDDESLLFNEALSLYVNR